MNKDIKQYEHAGKKWLNNPPVGLVSENTEPYSTAKKTYKYDPHLDPRLQWAGKAEHTSFEVPSVSLHVHERIDPKTIINTVQKEDTGHRQLSLFETEKMPLREAIEFYKHKKSWSKLARNLKAEIDEEKIEAFKGTVSLPFKKGDNARIAVKIIDDRGTESLRVISL